MSRVKRIILPLITLYLQIYGRITKLILRAAFFNKIKKVMNDIAREMAAMLYKLKAVCKIRYGHSLRIQAKESKLLNNALTWCKSSFFAKWYEVKVLYIGLGMLTLSAVLLVGILIGIKQDSWGTALQQEQQTEKQEVAVNQVIAKAIEVVPEPMTTALPKEEAVNVPTVFHSIKGLIKLDFGWQFNSLYKDWRYHAGVDIVGLEDQEVHTICSGEVTDVVQDKNTGLTVVVKNNDYKVYYGSLSEVAISKGSHVDMGQKIGKMGIFDGEPYHHVHLAIKKGEQAIDPKVVIINE